MLDAGEVVQRYWQLWQQGGRPEVGPFLSAAGPLTAEQVAEICWIDQRERWRTGDRVEAEVYLQLAPALADDTELALEVIFGEYLQREGHGEKPELAEFARRFPQFAERLRRQIDLHQTLQPPVASAGALPPACIAPVAPAGPKWPTVAGYDLLGELGQGGMSVVYEARQHGLGRRVALKMIRSGHLAGAEERARFRSEAAAVAALQHPNVVQIFAIGEQDGRLHLALELMAGGSLAQYLAARPQPAAWCARLVETLAQAVRHAHERGIVHRDLKPSNILLEGRGAQDEASKLSSLAPRPSPLAPLPKIADFGLAKRLEAVQGLTESGAILGTPSYMAPEQAAGKNRDVGMAADVYALGAILYECLTGRPPFLGETPLETVRQVLSQEPVSPRRLQPGVPRDLNTVCLKCLEKEPARRYASAAALAADLDRFLAGEPIHARPVSVAGRLYRWGRRKPALAAAALLATLALAIVVVLSISLALFQTRAAEHLGREQVKTRTALEESERQRLELEEADRRQRSTLRLSAGLAVDRGLALLDQDDIAPGMLWLTRGLEIAPPDAVDLHHVIRVNLAAWRPQLHPLRFNLDHPEPVFTLALSADGRTVVTASGAGRPEAVSEVRVWNLADGKLRLPPLTFAGTVRTVAISANGRSVAAAGDTEVRVWDGATGRPRCPPLRHADPVYKLAFSRDGTLLLTAMNTRKARLWDAFTGQPRGPVLTHPGWIIDVGFSPDDKLAVTRGGKRLCLWDTTTATPWKTPLEHDDQVHCAVFSPDGTLLLTGSHDQQARLWNVATGTLVLSMRHPEIVSRAAFSPDGRTLATSGSSWDARLWDVTTGQRIGQPLRHGGFVSGLAFRPDGKELVTLSGKGTTTHWDVATATLRARPVPPPQSGQTTRLTPDGGHFLTSGDKMVQVWEVASGIPFPPALGHADEVTAAAFAPGGAVLATGTKTGVVQRWRMSTGQPLGPPLSQRGGVTALAIGPDGRSLASVGDSHLWRWCLTSNQPLGEPLRFQSGCVAAAFAPSDLTLLTAQRDRTARCWDGASGQPRGPVLEPAGQVTAVAHGPGSTTHLIGTADGVARCWDAGTGQPTSRSFHQTGGLAALAVSADGRRVATAGADRHVRLWNAATGRQLGASLPHKQAIFALAISPDGRTLAVACRDKITRLWDVPTGRPLGPPLMHDAAANVLLFHPAGGQVLTAGKDRTARLWTLPTAATGDTARLVNGVQALTGQELDGAGGVVVLPEAVWRRRVVTGEF